MKKVLSIALIIFLLIGAVACDDIIEEEKERTFHDETEEERTYKGIVYEEAYYEYHSYKDRHGNRSHTDYYMIDKDDNKILDCHIYYNKSKHSAKGETSYRFLEGTYKTDSDGIIHTSFKEYENGKEISFTTEPINPKSIKEITVKKAISEMERCIKNSKAD